MAENQDPYSQYFVTVGLAKLEEQVIALAITLEADAAPAQASQVRRSYIKLLAELNAIAAKIAQLAEKEILHAEATSRVRDDTAGGGGPRLSANLGKSHPLPAVEGSVGVNYEPDLVSWWWTNEEGYRGLIGRELVGVFNPGGVAPNIGQFRVHPLFGGRSYASGEAPKGRGAIIQNPIPERRFVERGAAAAEVQWHTEIKAAKARFLAEVDRALTAKPRPKPGRRP